MSCPWRNVWMWVLVWAAISIPAQAGGGPEGVFLVVNSADDDSLTIANHFIQLRQIPLGSVFYIDWPGAPFEIDMGTFRSRILEPTLAEIKARQLEQQVDYVVYSSGFPYAVNFADEMDKGGAADAFPKGSLTGLTYLHEFVTAKSLLFRSPAANRYAFSTVNADASGAKPESAGFFARYGLDLQGQRIEEEEFGRHYLLSTMLGYTTGKRNNSVEEVIAYLTNAAQADYTRPSGTIYFVQNDNIRSAIRHDGFGLAVELLAEAGVRGEIVSGILPAGKNDVIGTVTGATKFDWPASKSTILPGAICDHFTSYGGIMNGLHTGQDLISGFLRAGAVASSGTVVEPYATAWKFPHSFLQVHYARGCSVAEAYYQSVGSPYQLLILGDPLCQPWAVPPTVTVDGFDASQPVRGQVQFQVAATTADKATIRLFEIFLDGQLVNQTLPQMPVGFNSALLPDGYHELRVVAVKDTALETQRRVVLPFVSVNQQRRIAADVSPRGRLFPDQPAFVNVDAPGSREIRLYRGRHLLGGLQGSSGHIPLEVGKLGSGPVTLQAVGIPETSALKPVFSMPIELQIERVPIRQTAP